MKIGIIIPARDEEETVGQIVARCRQAAAALGRARVVVADNGSRDRTALAAGEAQAEVVSVPGRGYGAACLAAIQRLGTWPDVLVFMDADGSSPPEEMGQLLAPILEQKADLVMGCRPAGVNMTLPQRWGNGLAIKVIRWRWGRQFLDIGPFRAIRRESFLRLGMKSRTWGWTLEMQILALLRRLRIEEVPVSWEKRLAGTSKISGSLSGIVRAGFSFLWTLTRLAEFSPQTFAPHKSRKGPSE